MTASLADSAHKCVTKRVVVMQGFAMERLDNKGWRRATMILTLTLTPTTKCGDEQP